MTDIPPAPGPIGCIRLSGRFDFSAFRRFRESYQPLLADEDVREIRVDLDEVEFVDSAALGMLLLLREKAVELGKRVSLANCTSSVRQSLSLSNFDRLFDILETRVACSGDELPR